MDKSKTMHTFEGVKCNNASNHSDPVKILSEELKHIKAFCEELKGSLHKNCLIENDKKAFDRMKNENIKMIADVNILKEDIKEINKNYNDLCQRINKIEEDNKNIRQFNKNLIKFIEGKPLVNNNPIKVDSSMPISELSAFNSVQTVPNMDNNIEKTILPQKKRFLIPKRDEY